MRALPNWLTASRVVMAGIFFGALTVWRWEDSAASKGHVDSTLLLCVALFVVAVLTDALDGYLARRWHVESAFGRIMDPFADKILVVGAFIFLAGPDFWSEFPDYVPVKLSGHGIQLSGIYPWMVVVIMGRELLVTSIRGVIEGQGGTFASDWWGKSKMILQSIMIPAVLLILAVAPVLPKSVPSPTTPWPPWIEQPWGRILIDVLAWGMLAVTVASGVPYVMRAFKALRVPPEHA
ncbi:CDP-diacylglycerol--glycerol-3-phosphate 3-phosphatidyltransferase [soil metagenome]